jgi:mRNA-degrading endonuclease toxin of MazEF toxin-antitoxin module
MRRIPTEVSLGRSEGLPRRCGASLDTITTVPKRILARRITELPPPKLAAIDRALCFALGLI